MIAQVNRVYAKLGLQINFYPNATWYLIFTGFQKETIYCEMGETEEVPIIVNLKWRGKLDIWIKTRGEWGRQGAFGKHICTVVWPEVEQKELKDHRAPVWLVIVVTHATFWELVNHSLSYKWFLVYTWAFCKVRKNKQETCTLFYKNW